MKEGIIRTKTIAALPALFFLSLSLPGPAFTEDLYGSGEAPIRNLTTLAGETAAPDLSLAQAKDSAHETEQKASEPLGEKPKLVDLSRLFLRQAAVLLKPGEVETEVDFRYLLDEVELAGFREREISVTPIARGGLLPRLEGFLEVPIVWRQFRFLASAGIPPSTVELDESKSGIGDINAGLKYILLREQGIWPDIIGSVNFVAPSGDAPDLNDPLAVPLGTGRWRLGGALTAIRSYDPAVVFGGIGYEYNFDETLSDIKVSGGDRFTYNFGVGFGVNDQLTLSGFLLGEVRNELEFDGVKQVGTDFEPISLRATTTYRPAKRHVLEPAVQFGLTDAAPDVEFRFAYIFKIR
jgi:hypothetical protein